MNNQAVAQISRIEDYLCAEQYAALGQIDCARGLACYQALLIMRMVAGDERYTLDSIMEVE